MKIRQPIDISGSGRVGVGMWSLLAMEQNAYRSSLGE
jgi:hypothetical protein